MRSVSTLVKNSMKLLIRNKVVWIFAVLLPVLAIFILNIDTSTTIASGKVDNDEIRELANVDEQLMYKGNDGLFTVKVYDSSDSQLSDLLLDSIIRNGLFVVYRYDSSQMSAKEVEKSARDNAANDRMGVILYIKSDFEKAIVEGNENYGVKLFRTSDDERVTMFQNCLNQGLEKLISYRNRCQGDASAIIKMGDELQKQQPDNNIELLNKDEETELSALQDAQLSKVAYSFGILSLSFFLCGVFIAYSVIEEKKTQVYTRLTLTNASPSAYILSKIIVGVLVSLIETVMIGIGLIAYVKIDFGLGQLEYLMFAFLLGVICNTLSLCIGVLAGNVMSANYAVFSLWCISNLLAGSYFPIDNASKFLRIMSYFMPQRWFIKASEMKLGGHAGTLPFIFGVFIAYMVIILSLGVVGLKIKNEE